MKGLRIKAAALCLAVMCMQTVTAAAFDDPALTYEAYKNGITINEESATTSVTDEFDEEFEEIPVTEENIEEVTETAPVQEESEPEKNDSKDSIPAESLTIYSYKTTVSVGDTFKIGYRIKPSKSTDKVTFSTSSKKTVTVDSSGNVTAVSPGSAIITAKASSGVKDRFYINVKEEEQVTDDS